ncbi:hypothetical protein D3C76_962250 [compost metagenome]
MCDCARPNTSSECSAAGDTSGAAIGGVTTTGAITGAGAGAGAGAGVGAVASFGLGGASSRSSKMPFDRSSSEENACSSARARAMRRCFSASCWALRRRASNSSNSNTTTAPPPARPSSHGLVSNSLNFCSSEAAGFDSIGVSAGAAAGVASAGTGAGAVASAGTGAGASAGVAAGSAGSSAGIAATVAVVAGAPAAPSACNLASWLFFSSMRRCSLSIWLCRSVMRLFSSALSRRLVSRLSWVTANWLFKALASPATPLPLAFPDSAETRLSLSRPACDEVASPRPRLVASSCCWPAPGLAT